MEFFVNNIQFFIPTIILRLIIRFYLYISYYLNISNNLVDNVIDVKNKNCEDKVAILTNLANEQHYEVPSEFFKLHLGNKLKYSSCEYKDNLSLAECEIKTLKNYQHLSKLNEMKSGDILELGSGWGSLSLYNAETYPHLNFTCFSNSKSQIEYINQQIKKNNLTNLTAIKEDYNIFCSKDSLMNNKKYDCIIGIETIEHCHNIEKLFYWINKRLKNNGLVFIQSLTLQHDSYLIDNDSWMGRNFFSGGQMLSLQSYLHYNKDLIVTNMIPRNGYEYSKTLEFWLNNLENIKDNIIYNFGKTHYEKFRMFYIQPIEAFRSHNGNNYMTCYYILEKRIKE